ncbi:MAG TPA: restriction endonuclease [Bacillota bacterium]|nr:restriction endonuclease [Bacillota bacterium]HOL12479.1 restriction endonuclease [Bacillota bacterium]HPP61226.1 restriction endonuclease [Bacillota bacterium]
MTMLISLTEWESIIVQYDDYSFDKAARQAAQKLNQAGVLNILELRDCIRIDANSHVGRVTLGSLQVNVSPKITGLPLYRLLKYAYGLKDMKLFEKAHHFIDSLDFFDLMVYQLYVEAEDLITRGLSRDYVRKEAELASPKGRIDVGRIASRAGLLGESLPCRYFERVEDTLLNQVLLAGLRFSLELVTDDMLRMGIRKLCSLLSDEVTAVNLDNIVIRRALNSLNRLTESYRSLLTIIDLLYNSCGIERKERSHEALLCGYFFDMNVFFERLILRLLHEYAEDYQVKDQYALRSMFAYDPFLNPQFRNPPTMRPDFALIRYGKVVRLLDAKYRDLWQSGLPTNMLYQLAVYALSGVGDNTATIIYPATEDLPAQKINVISPIDGMQTASVILQPIDLIKTADLIHHDRAALRRYINSIIVLPAGADSA